MKKALLVILLVFIFIIGISILLLYSKKLYWFSEVTGQVVKDGVPLPNVKVVRAYKSYLYGNHTESIQTDAEGKFYFSELTGRSLWWFIGPLMRGGVDQLIKIEFEGNVYTAWKNRHSRVKKPNTELEGKSIYMICDLNKPERAIKINSYHSIWGLSDLNNAYDTSYQNTEEQLNSNLDKLLEATNIILTSEEYKRNLIREINADGVIEVTDLQITNVKDLKVNSFSLTEQESVVLFNQGYYVNISLDIQTGEKELNYETIASVTYLLYDVNTYKLTKPKTVPNEELSFSMSFNSLYKKIIQDKIQVSELQEGLNKIFNDPNEIAYQEDMSAISNANELLNFQIKSLETNGTISHRKQGNFVTLIVSGEAVVLDNKEQKSVDFSYALLVDVNSIAETPYLFMAKDYEHFWKKIDNEYKKIPFSLN